MGEIPHNRQLIPHWDAGAASAAGGPTDPWDDPVDQRARVRLRLVRYQAGFLLLGVALMIASTLLIAQLVLVQLEMFPVLQILAQWDFAESTSIVLGSLFGVCLLWGRWPDQSWQRRSGLLLLLCLVDLVSWSLEHATTLGISDVAFGHDYLRESLGTAIGWSEFALIASLSADMAVALGEARAAELGRAARSLTTLTAAVWLLYFFVHTNWNPPVWPLRPFRLNLLTFNLRRCWFMLDAILLVQVTLLCLGAARACGRASRSMAAEDKARESFHSPSDQDWHELAARSAADFNPWEKPGDHTT